MMYAFDLHDLIRADNVRDRSRIQILYDNAHSFEGLDLPVSPPRLGLHIHKPITVFHDLGHHRSDWLEWLPLL